MPRLTSREVVNPCKEADMADHPNIFPCVKYRNAPAAVEWLDRAFGFKPKMVVPGEDGTVMHAELRNGAGMIMCGSTSAPDPANPWTVEGFGVYVQVDDVDAHHARAVGSPFVCFQIAIGARRNGHRFRRDARVLRLPCSLVSRP
ncbi:hypothetical protein BAL199_15212, partial [alpha proteobacterium BAL199]